MIPFSMNSARVDIIESKLKMICESCETLIFFVGITINFPQ